jgi:hypothetical protein
MHVDDQCCELVDRDLVMPEIAVDDLRDLMGIDPPSPIASPRPLRGCEMGKDTDQPE